MSDLENLELREFSSVDAKRAGIMLAIFLALGIISWFMLSGIQSLLVPSADGGSAGSWVIRPIRAFHFAASAVMAIPLLLLIDSWLQRRWAQEDLALGSRYRPYHGQHRLRSRVVTKGIALLLIYVTGLVLYLSSWSVVAADGIETQLPWGKNRYTFQEIVALEVIPENYRSDSITQNGPWYSIKFKNGGHLTVSYDNEGSTKSNMAEMANFIAERSGRSWKQRTDARPR